MLSSWLPVSPSANSKSLQLSCHPTQQCQAHEHILNARGGRRTDGCRQGRARKLWDHVGCSHNTSPAQQSAPSLQASGQRGGKEGIEAIHKGAQRAPPKISSQARGMVHHKGGLAEIHSGMLTSGVTWEQE